MNSALQLALDQIDVTRITDEDKHDLLVLFNKTANPGLRNRLAILLADLQYDTAIPYLVKKINQKSLYNQNGTIVYALSEFDSPILFLEFVKVICTQHYEARAMALTAIDERISSISEETRRMALMRLKRHRAIERKKAISGDDYYNSNLHFMDELIRLLTTN